jgi:hypothetical protein
VNLENIRLSQIPVTEEQLIILIEGTKIVKFIESKREIVVSRDWGGERTWRLTN